MDGKELAGPGVPGLPASTSRARWEGVGWPRGGGNAHKATQLLRLDCLELIRDSDWGAIGSKYRLSIRASSRRWILVLLAEKYVFFGMHKKPFADLPLTSFSPLPFWRASGLRSSSDISCPSPSLQYRQCLCPVVVLKNVLLRSDAWFNLLQSSGDLDAGRCAAGPY